MAVRSESVKLSLIDNGFTSGMAKAAAATALLDRNLNNLDGSQTSSADSSGKAGSAIRKMGDDSERSGKQIDKLSGRLALMAQAASVLGPALVPLGAATVPVLGALTAGLGAAAGALGVTLLATNGLGDAFDALNAAQLEPTTENIGAMRDEFARIGPDATQFVKFIDSLGPQLTELQMTARAGLFPGVEDGITSLLKRLPQVSDAVGNIAQAMGDLAADAGDALASSKFDAFFDYVENQAGPILSDFGRAAGNVFETIANVMVALDPATRSFTDGLLDKTRELAEWSRQLGTDQGFQSFLNYVRESGPQALDFIGTLITSLAQVVQAVAPIGAVVLPILTKVIEAFGALAASDIGSPIFAGLAAFSVYTRAASLATAATTRFGTAALVTGANVSRSSALMATGARGAGLLANNFGKVAATAGLVALSMTDLDDKVGLSNTASLTLLGTFGGPWGAALGAATGLTLDLVHANDDLVASTKAANAAGASDPLSDLIAKRKKLLDELNDDSVMGKISSFLDVNDYEDKAAQAAVARIDSFIAARRELNSLDKVDPLAALGEYFSELGGDVLNTTSLLYDFSDALARANGFLDQRSAVRNYEAALDAVNASLKENGKTLDENTPKGRANQEVLDGIARSALVVADSLKGDARRTFLDDLRGNLRGAAEQFGATKAEVRDLLREMGLLDKKRAKPEADLDTSGFDARQKRTAQLLERLDLDQADPEVNLLIGKFLAGNDKALDRLRALSRQTADPKADLDAGLFDRGIADALGGLRTLDRSEADPTADLLTGGFDAAVASTMAKLAALDGRTADTYVVTHYSTTGGRPMGGQAPGSAADGGTVPKTSLPYADRHLYLLADGEEVISNRFGQADAYRAAKGIPPARRLAAGGTAGFSPYPTGNSTPGIGPNSQLFGINQAFLSIRELGDRLAALSRGQLRDMAHDIDDVNGKGLKKLSASMEKATAISEKQYDAAKERLDEEMGVLKDLRQARKSLAEDVASSFRTDVFGGNLDVTSAPGFSAGLNTYIAAHSELQLGNVSGDDRRAAYLDSLTPAQISALQAQASVGQLQNDARNAEAFEAILQQLRSMGLSGGAFTELATSGNLAQAQSYAAMGPDFIATLEASYAERNADLKNLGQYVGNVRFGADIREQLQETRQLNRAAEQQLGELREIRQSGRRVESRLAALEKRAQTNPQETGAAVGRAVNGAVAAGQRAAK